MGLHDQMKQYYPQYLQTLQKQVNPKLIIFPQHSCARACEQAPKFHGCKAIATTFRVTSQLSNLHLPGVGTSNKNKIILAQDVAYVKFLRVYLVLFRVNLCLI